MEKKPNKKDKTEKVLGKLTTAAGHVFLMGDMLEVAAYLAEVPAEERGRLAIERIGRGKTGLRPFEAGDRRFAVGSFYPASELILMAAENGLHLVPVQVDKWRVTLAMPTLTEVVYADLGAKPIMPATVSVPSGLLAVVRIFPTWRHEMPPLEEAERAKLGRGGQHGTVMLLAVEPGEWELAYERLSRNEEWGTVSGHVIVRPPSGAAAPPAP